MIEDLTKEKSVLEKEIRKLIDNRFGSERENEFNIHLKELQLKIENNERNRKEWMMEREKLLETISAAKGCNF